MTAEQDREGLLPKKGQKEIQLEAEIAANGYAVVTQPVEFLYKSPSTKRDIYDFKEEDLPKVNGTYLDFAVLDQTPVGTEIMTSRVLLYNPDKVSVINSRGTVHDVDHIRRVATRQHYAILVDDPDWGLIAVKSKQSAPVNA